MFLFPGWESVDAESPSLTPGLFKGQLHMPVVKICFKDLKLIPRGISQADAIQLKAKGFPSGCS